MCWIAARQVLYCPVHNNNEIAEPLMHGNVGNIGTPDMVGLCNGQISQKIGVDYMAGMRFREAGLLIEGFYSHFLHESADMTSANLITFIPQFVPDASRAHERIVGMNLINEPHKAPVFLADRVRKIVNTRPGEVKYAALMGN